VIFYLSDPLFLSFSGIVSFSSCQLKECKYFPLALMDLGIGRAGGGRGEYKELKKKKKRKTQF
jgi:hypothetical protein